MENFVELYKEETKELLNEVQDTLLELEERPDDRELIDKVFRAMHNMKGNGAMFGFDNISAFTHDIETVYDKVRDGELPVTPELINLTLEACDQINLMLLKPGADLGKQKEKVDRILEQFASLLPEKKSGSAQKENHAASAKKSDTEKAFLIHFVPPEELFLTGTNPMLLFRELLELGEGVVFAHYNQLPEFSHFDPQKCYLSWTVVLKTRADIRAVQNVFIFVEDESQIIIEEIKLSPDLKIDRIREKFRELKSPNFEKICQFLGLEKPEASKQVSAEKKQVDLEEKKSTQTSQPKQISQKHVENISGIRVSSDKLDNLINLVGELVTIQASLTQQVLSKNDSQYLPIVEELERLTGGLRDIAMEIRLVPVGTLFSKYKRLVRDLSRQLGKNIELVLEGGETELDKTIIDRLGDPLVHLIRNSIDHGIESPQEREQKGKASQGTIRLSAQQRGADVAIQISDDGWGMNPDKIFKKAVEKGLIAPDAKLTKSEILQLIFKPGFSTAENVNDVSGRGVGMDVVKKNVEELRGTIEVKSEIDKGTEITLRLPLTLGIIDGLVVRAANEKFVLPISIVQDCHEFTDELRKHFKHCDLIDLRGEVIPFIRLRRFFGIHENGSANEHLIIVNSNENKIGLVVDEIEGEHQIVIKSLGKLYRKIQGISGATILGDGTVALILDAPVLAKAAEKLESMEKQAIL